ncbi:MAG TPA: hypothetical protein VGO09_07270 [Flavisolibacter sp.]|nr:hypothetical protein [Flavisolibacter sp.]
MSTSLSEKDRSRIEEMYLEVKTMVPTLQDLEKIEVFLNEAILIAEKYDLNNNELLKNLIQTKERQLRLANQGLKSNKIYALKELKLFFQGDLLGSF